MIQNIIKTISYFIILISFNLLANNTIQITTKGMGGDYNATTLIINYFQENGISIKYEPNIKIDNLNNSKYFIIGQGAVSDFIKNNQTQELSGHFFLYSHLLSKEFIEFAEKHNQNIIFIATESEFKIHNKELQNIKVLKIPLALPTYMKEQSHDLYENNKKIIDLMLSKPTIHLGGGYKNTLNKDIVISDSQFSQVKIKNKINFETSVSIILHPRTFKDILTNINLIKNRLIAIAGKDSIKNTTFFADNDLYQIVTANKEFFKNFNIQLSPPYNGILYCLNELKNHKMQYVSTDQYNAFTDIKIKVQGFLLNEEDQNQQLYLKEYNNTKLDFNIYKEMLNLVKE